MEILFDFLGSFVDLIDGLFIFFFEPMKDIPEALFARFETIESPFWETLVDILLRSIRSLDFLQDCSLASVLVGGGVLLLLLWRFIQFIIPLLE